MKRTYVILCCFCALALSAQQIQVVKCEQIGQGFYPQLDKAGTQLFLTSENYKGLSILDLSTKHVEEITTDDNAGYMPVLNAQSSTIFYRSRSMQPNGRMLVAVKSYSMTNKERKDVLSPRRDLGILQEHANGIAYVQQNQLRRATLGKATAPTPNYVSNEDLKLVLYTGTRRVELTPRGTDVNYIWSSLSPNGMHILYNTKFGTEVCDFQGNIIAKLGHLNAPVWYNDDLVVGMCDEDDGHHITASVITIASLDGKFKQELTDGKEIAMYPSVSAEAELIAFNTLDGKVYVMQISQ